jgi:hypothetical protein
MTSFRIGVAICLLGVTLSPSAVHPAIRADDLVGTWELVSVKDLKTGVVDQVGTHQRLWLQLTKSHWTYLWMDLDRKVVTPEELQRLPPDRQVQENYTKVWDADGRHRFWGAGGKYRIEGNRFVYTNDVSIEPYMLTRTGVEVVARVDATTYVRHSVNQQGEVVRESVFRRIG